MAAQGDHRHRGEGPDRPRRRRGRAGHLRAAGRLTSGSPDEAAARRWIERHRGGASPEEVLAFFDRLPPVSTGGLIGRWRGSGLPTGSPLDGLLEAYGWWGKEVLDAETVHPLLFPDRRGAPRPLRPPPLPASLLRRIPLVARPAVSRRLFAVVRPLLTTSRPVARLREVGHRGLSTAALVYDALPVVDVFRRVDDDVVLGLMDMRGLEEPFFFLLRRAHPQA